MPRSSVRYSNRIIQETLISWTDLHFLTKSKREKNVKYIPEHGCETRGCQKLADVHLSLMAENKTQIYQMNDTLD